MLQDGISLIEGSSIDNLTVASGTAYPSSPTAGELFYRTDLLAMYVHNGTSWEELGGGGGGDAGTLTGTTLASNVLSSSLTSVGTLSSLAIGSSGITFTNKNGTTSITTLGTDTSGQIAGSVAIVGGQQNNTSASGGNVSLIGGPGGNLNTTGGNINLTAGTGIFGGAIILSTPASNSPIERLRILNTGAWSVGAGGGAYGTTGQVLTSNGNAAPTWQTAAGGVIGTTTQVAYNSAGTMVGSGNLTFSGQTLSIGVFTNNQGARLNVTGLISSGDDNGNNGPLTIRPAHFASVNAGHTLNLIGGISGRAGGAVNITGGAESTNGYGAGAVNISGGGGFNGTGYAGSVVISGGVGTASHGAITLKTADTIRLQVIGTGAWSVGTSGTAYGTSGQVLTSNGNAPPTWQAGGGGGTASILANATTLGTVTNTATSITPIAGTTPGTFTITQASGGGQPGLFTVSGGNMTGGGTAGDLTVNAGNGNVGNNTGNGGALILRGGASGTGVVAPGGAVTIQGGTAGINNGSVGGAVTINGGLGGNAAAAGGTIIFQTAPAAAGTTLVERLRILNTGAWSVGTGGAAYGTSGQVLTSNGNAAPTWQAAGAETQQAVTAAASTTLTYTSGPTVVLTMNASITTLTLSGAPTSGTVGTFTLFITQDATGSRTITWPAAVKWANGVAPTLTTTGTKIDIVTLTTYNAGSTWFGLVVGQNF